jgi:beta-lactamase regulating signal transducer with metallopeptidase domain
MVPADIVVRTTVLLLAAFVATRLMPRAAATTRHWVWTLAVAGSLVLPIASSIGPAWRVLPWPHARVAPSIVAATPGGTPRGGPSSALAGAGLAIEPSTLQLGPRLLGITWACIALVLLARIGLGMLAVRRLVRHARPAGARWRLLLDETSETAGIARRVRLLVSRDIAVPMTWTGRRPTLLLPVDATEWTDDRARLVLLHELAHVRRADWLTHALARVLVALHWFNPLAWIALRAMTSERERACDDFVLARGARPTEYAQHLLDIARAGFDSSAYAMAPAMARAGELEGRLLSILTPRRRQPRALATPFLTAAAVCLTLALASAAPRGSVPPPAPSAPEPAAVTNSLVHMDDTPEQKREARRTRAALGSLANTALSDEKEDAREKATSLLARRTEPNVVEPLLRALKDPSSQVREKAALGLAMRRDPRVVDSLLEAATDPDSQVREKVAIALGLSGDARAIDALTKGLEDPDPQVREKAASGLTLFSLSSLVRRGTTR